MTNTKKTSRPVGPASPAQRRLMMGALLADGGLSQGNTSRGAPVPGGMRRSGSTNVLASKVISPGKKRKTRVNAAEHGREGKRAANVPDPVPEEDRLVQQAVTDFGGSPKKGRDDRVIGDGAEPLAVLQRAFFEQSQALFFTYQVHVSVLATVEKMKDEMSSFVVWKDRALSAEEKVSTLVGQNNALQAELLQARKEADQARQELEQCGQELSQAGQELSQARQELDNEYNSGYAIGFGDCKLELEEMCPDFDWDRVRGLLGAGSNDGHANIPEGSIQEVEPEDGASTCGEHDMGEDLK